MVSPKYPPCNQNNNSESDSSIGDSDTSYCADDDSDDNSDETISDGDNPMVDENKRKKDESNPDDMFFQNYSMNPTIAEQMTISIKRKRMSSAINVKRKMLKVNF